MKMNAVRLAIALRNDVESHPAVAGARLPSINEIGTKYKVSPATALKAVKSLESEGMVECIRGRGVFLKARENGGAIWRVGLLSIDFGGSAHERQVAFSSYLSSAAEVLRQSGRTVTRLLLEDLTRDRAAAREILQDLDALIVSFSCIDPVTIPLLREWGRPVVVLQHEMVLGLPFHQVIPDLLSGFEKVVRLPALAGIRTLAVAATPIGTHVERVARFHEALRECPGTAGAEVRRFEVEKVVADTGRLTGRLLGERLFAEGVLPDAIFCPSDFLSFGILDVALARGLRPGRDFKLVSYDNLEGAGLLPFGEPLLTSVENPRDAISRQAAALLLDLERRGRDCTHIVRLPCELIERLTTTRQ